MRVDVFVESPEEKHEQEKHAQESAQMQDMWSRDQGARRLERRVGRPQALLAQAPRGDEGKGLPMREPDLGDLVVVLLASTLAGLRDRLAGDGFDGAAGLVADLTDVADDYINSLPCGSAGSAGSVPHRF